MIHRYFLLIIAMCALLVGVQLPNFVTQYQQRLDAQYTEAMVYYRHYKAIADKYLDGDMNALLATHENSASEIFKAEAVPLRELIRRVELFEFERQQLNTSLVEQLWFIATEANPELRKNTWQQYSYNVPMTQQAVVTGILSAFLVIIVLDICIGGCRRIVRRGRRQAAHKTQPTRLHSKP
jgi:hypothetical protein